MTEETISNECSDLIQTLWGQGVMEKDSRGKRKNGILKILRKIIRQDMIGKRCHVEPLKSC